MAAKLGIRAGAELCAVDPPDGYRGLLAALPVGVRFVDEISDRTDLVHVFTTSKAGLAKALRAYRRRLKPDAVVWVSWPKRAAKVATDVTEDTIREIALPLGFVDVKVCAVTDVWSGLKLVVRKEHR